MSRSLLVMYGNSTLLSEVSLMTVNARQANHTESGFAPSDWIKIMHLFYTPTPMRQSSSPLAMAAVARPRCWRRRS